MKTKNNIHAERTQRNSTHADSVNTQRNSTRKSNDLKALTNWRIWIISAMATIAFLLFGCVSDDKFAFYATKILAVAVTLLAIFLCRMWLKNGEINDVISFLNENS